MEQNETSTSSDSEAPSATTAPLSGRIGWPSLAMRESSFVFDAGGVGVGVDVEVVVAVAVAVAVVAAATVVTAGVVAVVLVGSGASLAIT